jgi:hypothetical protein
MSDLQTRVVPRAQTLSELAYVAGRGKTPAQAAGLVNAELAGLLKRYQQRLDILESIKSPAAALGRESIHSQMRFLKSLKVEKATRDAVAFTRVMKSGDKQVLFAFRGTAQLRDLVPDAQILFNAKKMKRLDEAEAFAKSVMKGMKGVKPQNIQFFGHSLGGFIAEGVRNLFVGSKALTIHAGVPRFFGWFKGKGGERVVNAWAKYQTQLEKAFDLKHGEKLGRTTRLVTYGDKVSGSKGISNGRANVLQYSRNSAFSPLANHKLGSAAAALDGAVPTADNILQTTGQKWRFGEFRGAWSDDVKDQSQAWRMVVERKNAVKDPGRLARARTLLKDASLDARMWLARNSVRLSPTEVVPITLKSHPGRYMLHRSYLEGQKAVAAASRAKAVAKKGAAKVGTALKVTGKVLGKALLLGQVGHVAVETAKDYAKMQEKLAETGEVDHELVRNMMYAPLDAVVGRGTTHSIVEGSKKMYSGLKDSCSKSKEECGALLLNGTKATGELIGKGLSAVGKAAKSCHSDYGKCGEKVGGFFKAIGGAVHSWGRKTIKFVKDRRAKSKARELHCGKKENVEICKREDEVAEANRVKGWKAYRKEHKLAAVAYAPIAAVKSLFKSPST